MSVNVTASDKIEEDPRKMQTLTQFEPALELDPSAPKDKYGLVWWIFSMLGVGVLFPWDAFITAYDYFSYLYPDFPFEFALSIAYNLPSIVILLLSVKIAPKFSFSSRIIFALIVNLLVLIAIPLFAHYLTRSTSLWTILGGVFITGSSQFTLHFFFHVSFFSKICCHTAILFGSILGLAALFPPQYTGAVMSGSGVAGLAAAALRIITKVSLPDDEKGLELSSKIYFWIGAFILLMCIGSYVLLLRLEFARHHLEAHENVIKRVQQQNVTPEESMVLLPHEKLEETSIMIVFKKIWPQALNVFSVFFVTLSLFPGITSLIPTESSLGDWFQIFMISLFMVGDLIGRTAPKWFTIPQPKHLWIPVFVRLSFYAFFILCIRPKVFVSDAWAYTFMALFALSNGYLGTLSMMYGPMLVSSHEKETAGILMSFFLNFGIFTAVHFALLLLYLVTGSIGITF